MFQNSFCSSFLVLVLGVTLAIHISGSNSQVAHHRLRRQGTGGVCELPEPLQNGKYKPSEKRCPEDDTRPACKMLPGSYVPPDWVVHYSCDRGYAIDSTKSNSVCYNSDWVPKLPTACNKLCPPLSSHSMDLNCTFGGTKVSCDQPMRPGTVTYQSCKEYHSPAFELESSELTCLSSGVWDYPVAYCTQGATENQRATLNNAIVEVEPVRMLDAASYRQRRRARYPRASSTQPMFPPWWGLQFLFQNSVDNSVDDVCKREGDNLWTCKKVDECPSAQEALKNGMVLEPCHVSKNPPLICCEPTIHNRIDAGSDTQLEERKSSKMCKKYAESVYLIHQTTRRNLTIDTCALVEPIDAAVPEVTDDIPEISSNAVPREFPHVAVIGYGSKTHKRPAARCAGSLISERYVLSLASCSQIPSGPASWVRLGDYNVDSEKDDKYGDSRTVIYDIEKRINHPEYVKPRPNEIGYNDIALFELKTPVQFNQYIRPICLYEGDQFAKTFALTTGWGPVEVGERPSEILQKVNVTIADNKACSDAYKFHGVESVGLDTEVTVCAAMVNGRDPCMNVPGSPLQIRVRDPYCMYRLAGLKYFGRNCFVKAPGVYTRVSQYLDWIESIVWP